jgi:PKD repeat protein
MKRILLIVVSVLVAATMFAQSAAKSEIQSLDMNARVERGTRDATNWGTFTNFTATDMNGVEHNIQSYLDQGKYVAIDFFCAWCPPCWQYHQSGIFENLYETYGQGGSGEFVVLLVEDETTNTAAQITGTSTNQQHSGYSQGDFTNNGTNPVPIIDATTPLSGHVSLYEGYVPSIYLICPSGYAYDIYDNQFGSARAIYNFATSTCPTETSTPYVNINVPGVIEVDQSARFTASVFSVTNDVTYAWTFEGGSPETATTASPSVVWNTLGEHNVSLTVTNANGSKTANVTINVVDCDLGISEFPFAESFESGIGCWTYRSMNTQNASALGICEFNDGTHGFKFSSYNNGASNYNQYLISPLLNHNGELELSFDYALYNPRYQERFKIMYSTTNNTVDDLIEVPNTTTTVSSQSFQSFSCTVPAEAKYLAINYCPTSDMTYLYIDDIRVEANHEDPASIEGAFANGVNIFPNPTTGIVNIQAEGLNKVVVYDVTGRMMMSVANDNTIDISNLEAGVYFFSVETENGSAMKKLVKE